ncbi:chromate efflux transporter [Porticoccaceae bacterium LTM1]|nr:chromate efflux transporter [Porticoccaceae bacterium LTM1]
MVELFRHFLLLGCHSFGGPAAHLGYFQREFVERHQWVSQSHYQQLVALSQFLPGPASSQVGFAIGYHRGGLAGAILAFIGFTLPSFLLMYGLAVMGSQWLNTELYQGLVHGLKLLAVVVVADAVLTMWNSFCQRQITKILAVGTAAGLWLLPGLITQFGLLLAAAALGCWRMASAQQANNPTGNSKGVSRIPLILFVTLLLGLPVVANHNIWFEFSNQFFQAGSWVFGGGHVVLPLLQNLLADNLPADQFLAGYAAAQAMPGPMFSLASYLGASLMPEQALLAALIATLMIFLPGFLLILGLQGYWQRLVQKPHLAGAVAGISASVVGLLIAALYQPLFISSVASSFDMALVVAGLLTLRALKLPILWLVLAFATVGALGA